MLVHQVPSHSNALNGGKTHFYEENRITRIAFNFEVISYKLLLDLLNLPPRFSRNVAPPHFTTIQDNMDDKSFKEELLFIIMIFVLSVLTVIPMLKKKYLRILN